MTRFLFAVFSAVFCCCASAGPPPVAAVRNVDTNYFGTTVRDPYRYFENVAAPEVARWMKAHDGRARATLAAIPGRAAMYERLVEYDSAVAQRVGQPVRVPGDLYFYEKRGADENQFKLYMRRGIAGEERLLVDPEAMQKKTGKPHAINWFVPSPDGRHVAYGVSSGGSEAAVLHVLDTRSGKEVGVPITRADFGAVDWAPDGTMLLYNRLRAVSAKTPPTQKYQHSQVHRLVLGTKVVRPQPVFGTAALSEHIDPADLPAVSLSHDGRWAFGIVLNGTQREIALFVAPQRGVLAGKPQWRRLLDSVDGVTGFSYFDGTLYLRSLRGAPRQQLLALELAPEARLADARVIVPQSERVITNSIAAADALYIEMRDGSVKRLFKRAHGLADAALIEVKLPVEGSFELSGDEGGPSAADPRLPGLLIGVEGWTRARQLYAVAADGSVSNTGLQPQGPYDAPNDIVATEALVTSRDGAKVPMSIIHRKTAKLDGSNPTILYGYASYGSTEEPFFSISRLAWLDAGGVYAVANPRGSGVYGDDWYRAGLQATKPNTWRDFIACAEYLIAQRYTTPAKLGIFGGSAGGILVGRAMTERPDLFAAVISAVGVLDTLRMETTANGVPNIPEFGSTKTEAGFRALYAMSTYEHIRDGVAYPAMLLMHGVNDPRVEVWESTKAAARLMAATSSGKPILVRLDYDAGHGVGATKQQMLAERADMLSFLLWQMGQPGYQPAEPAGR